MHKDGAVKVEAVISVLTKGEGGPQTQFGQNGHGCPKCPVNWPGSDKMDMDVQSVRPVGTKKEDDEPQGDDKDSQEDDRRKAH